MPVALYPLLAIRMPKGGCGMQEQEQTSRRQILALGAMAGVGAAVMAFCPHGLEASLSGPQSAGRAQRDSSQAPCIGEPGYAERMARLFGEEAL